ncbi:MAG: hypothetical protein RL065_1146 [Bacteroidota bacterium]
MNSIAIILSCLLVLIVHFIGTIALSARIVGTETRRIASSTSIFNIVNLVANFSTMLLAPILAKNIEQQINLGNKPQEYFFHIILLCSSIGCLIGAFAIPTVHRFMKHGVDSLYHHTSIFKVVINSVKLSTFIHLKNSFTMMNKSNFYRLLQFKNLPYSVLIINILVYSFVTNNVLACLYAGILNPEYRSTALSLNGITVGLGTLGILLFIEPFNATITDKVMEGTVSKAYFRKYLAFLVIARFVGTLLAQFTFIPLSKIISIIAQAV